MHTRPAITMRRNPTFGSTWLVTTDIVTHPRRSGVSAEPASVAERPSAVCTNSGTNDSAPNIAMPVRKPTTVELPT